MRHTICNLNAQPIRPWYEWDLISGRPGAVAPELLALFPCSDISMAVKNGPLDTRSFTIIQSGDLMTTCINRSGNYSNIDWNSS